MIYALIVAIALLLMWAMVKREGQATNVADLEEAYTVSYTNYSLMVGNLDKPIISWYLYDRESDKIVETHTFCWYKPVSFSQTAMRLLDGTLVDHRRKLQLIYKTK